MVRVIVLRKMKMPPRASVVIITPSTKGPSLTPESAMT